MRNLFRRIKTPLIKVDKAVLQPGINRLVLMDKKLKPISERLYFSKNYDLSDVEVQLNQEEYSTRSNVQLELIENNEYSDASYSSLSVSVVDEKAIGQNGPSVNILSWLLIDSELKGNIISPAHFFVDDVDMASARKLNLLMLTQGWSNYLWNTLPEKDDSKDFYEAEGFSISGKVKKLLSNKPVTDGEVEINISRNDYFFNAKSNTDKEGRFSFDNINFSDTAFVFLQARNKNGKLSTEILLDPLFIKIKNPEISVPYRPVKESQYSFSYSLYEQQYFSEQDLQEYLLRTGSILIEEVSIEGQKSLQGDGHFRIYSKPLESFEIKNTDLAYRNIADYLQGRVAGVMVVGDKISIHGPGSFTGPATPLFLLDGSVVEEEMIMNIPMNDIEMVEVLKRPGDAAIFGANGGNGVISVFTKRGGYAEAKYKYLYGTLSKIILGYDSYREFYAPIYTPENIDTEKPDHRLTLYWNPYVQTENGKASLSFFSSDDLSRYKVIVEGMTDDGTICLGSAKFEVNERYTGSDK